MVGVITVLKGRGYLMGLLRQYDLESLLKAHYGDTDKVITTMKKAVRIYWMNRSNQIARSRLHSAINIIRTLQ